MKQIFFSCAIAAAVSTAGCNQSNNDAQSRAVANGLPACKVLQTDQIGGPISLLNHDGQRVTEDAFKGRDTLIYFGYTYCPDICPVALTVAGAAMDLMPEELEKPHTVLISVDPERDTPESMSAYIESNGFPSDITGLTGTADDVAAAAQAFRAVYKRDEMPDSAAGYTVSHSSYFYLMDGDWNLKTIIPVDLEGRMGPREVAGCLTELSEPLSASQ